MNSLRQGTITWAGRKECLDRHRKQVVEGTHKNGKPKLKYYWPCLKCGNWFREEKQIEVDHIKEIGGFRGSWDDIINVMYNSANLQPLCIDCHKEKTITKNASVLFQRKTPKIATDSDL